MVKPVATLSQLMLTRAGGHQVHVNPAAVTYVMLNLAVEMTDL